MLVVNGLVKNCKVLIVNNDQIQSKCKSAANIDFDFTQPDKFTLYMHVCMVETKHAVYMQEYNDTALSYVNFFKKVNLEIYCKWNYEFGLIITHRIHDSMYNKLLIILAPCPNVYIWMNKYKTNRDIFGTILRQFCGTD